MECSVFFDGEGGDLIASEPLRIRVTLFSKLRGHLFWGILLPFLLLKENRTRQVLWIFLPFAAWVGIAAGAGALWGAPGEVMTLLPVFLCGLFLAGHRSQGRSGWAVLGAAAGFAAVIHGGWIWTGQAEGAMYAALGSGILFLVAAGSFLLARLCCRRRYAALPLAMFLLLFVLLGSVLLAMVAAFLMFLRFAETGMGSLAMMLAGMAVPAVLIGAVLYLLLLSFLAVPFSSEFYRSRLCGLLKLKREAPPAVPPPWPAARP